MKLNKKVMAMALAGTLTIGGVAVGAAQKVETVQRRYENIQVKVDGDKEVPVNEPFFIGNSVYVGLRDAGNLVGAQVGWDSATKTVTINTDNAGGSADVAALKSDLASKNLQLATANSKIAQLEEKLAQYEDNDEDKDDDDDKDTSDTDLDLDDLEDFLDDEFEDEHDVDWSFDINGDEDGLEVDIKFDSDEDGTAFSKISKSSLEKLAEDVCEEIQKEVEDEYEVEDIEIEGTIYDIEERETIAEFDMDDRGRLDYEYVKEAEIDSDDLSKFALNLYHDYKNFPELQMPGYDSTSIKVQDVVLREVSGDIVFEIHTNLSDFGRKYWDLMSESGASELEIYMDDMMQEIEDEFDVDAEGFVYDEDDDEMASYDGDFDLH